MAWPQASRILPNVRQTNLMTGPAQEPVTLHQGARLGAHRLATVELSCLLAIELHRKVSNLHESIDLHRPQRPSRILEIGDPVEVMLNDSKVDTCLYIICIASYMYIIEIQYSSEWYGGYHCCAEFSSVRTKQTIV